MTKRVCNIQLNCKTIFMLFNIFFSKYLFIDKHYLPRIEIASVFFEYTSSSWAFLIAFTGIDSYQNRKDA